MINEEWSQVAANAIAHAAEMSRENIRMAAAEHTRPSVLWKPRLSIDGNQWCALYGDDLQNGVAGFGDSPELAMWDFDRNWFAKLREKNTGETK